ncbi:S8 family serine peptidase [uncultured Tissierella sp.]|uniref:S8 family serine peptidase n=1 Tax=uncultured Tissierella sp. TaxID=448160 RepID=UPI002804BE10|nr:S8 family serine peptidase [uncultured Tissierella sp.]MDU5080131.1 S8 family serine peptidase [Bacillota bacterium]
MKNKIIGMVLAIVLISTAFTGCKQNNDTLSKAEDNSEQKIQVYPEPLNYNRGKITDISEIFDEQRNRYDLRSYDASDMDLTRIELRNFIFDSQTIWPEKLPVNFDVETIIKYGKQPGLGIDYLHKENITGKGVNVGIIDGRLLADHEEFKDNIVVYEEIFDMDSPAHYHGTPITSILCGKDVGVAPEANIYYIAYLEEDTDYEEGYVHLANAIERMVEINKALPEDNKIKVLSISSGWDPESKNAEAIYNAIEKAEAENIFVVTARLYETHKLFFNGVNREPMSDPEKIESYYLKYYVEGDGTAEDILLTPMDARWLASPTGKDEYVMYSNGAWSMVIPYISGLYTLACEVDPDMTPEKFWDMAISTGDSLDEDKRDDASKEKNMKIVNPVKLISEVKSKK